MAEEHGGAWGARGAWSGGRLEFGASLSTFSKEREGAAGGVSREAQEKDEGVLDTQLLWGTLRRDTGDSGTGSQASSSAATRKPRGRGEVAAGEPGCAAARTARRASGEAGHLPSGTEKLGPEARLRRGLRWTFAVCWAAQEPQAGRRWGTANQAVRSPYIPRMPPREVRTEPQLPPSSWPEAQGAGSCDPTQCGISAGPRSALGMERGFPGLPQTLQIMAWGASLSTAVLRLQYPGITHPVCAHLWAAHSPHDLGITLL